MSTTEAREARTPWTWMLARRHVGSGLTFAVLGVAGGLGLRLAAGPWLADRSALLFFVPAVVGAAATTIAGTKNSSVSRSPSHGVMARRTASSPAAPSTATVRP